MTTQTQDESTYDTRTDELKSTDYLYSVSPLPTTQNIINWVQLTVDRYLFYNFTYKLLNNF